jgi:hypothetical protein
LLQRIGPQSNPGPSVEGVAVASSQSGPSVDRLLFDPDPEHATPSTAAITTKPRARQTMQSL